MINLVGRIKELENEKTFLTVKFRNEISKIERELKKLRETNEACEKCNGTGKYVSEVFGETGEKDCNICNGSGKCK